MSTRNNPATRSTTPPEFRASSSGGSNESDQATTVLSDLQSSKQSAGKIRKLSSENVKLRCEEDEKKTGMVK